MPSLSAFSFPCQLKEERRKQRNQEMMILCKTFHTLLGFPDPHHLLRTPTRYAPSPESAGGLRCLVVDSPAVCPAAPPPRPDPGSWGLREADGGGGGLALCTENLGAESCEEGAVAAVDDVEEAAEVIGARSPRRIRRSSRRRREDFPPPLRWLAGTSGRRSCFMKGERRDGRFLLTEVTIERKEVLRASRQDGRLRLHLIGSSSPSSSDEDEEVEQEKEKEEEEDRWEMVGPTPTATSMAVGSCTRGAVSGDHKMEMWWGHRFVTTA